MTSLTTIITSPSTTAATSSPGSSSTNQTATLPINILVTEATAPALNNLKTLQSTLALQEATDIASAKEEEELAKKIGELRQLGKDDKTLSRARSSLYNLIEFTNKKYSISLKEEILDLLIELFEKDSAKTHETAVNVLDIVIKLNKDLVASKAQGLIIPIQQKLLKAFLAAVELYLRHYNMKNHVNGITDAQKKEFLDTQSALSDLNTQETIEIKFLNGRASEACKRLKTDLPSWKDGFVRFSKVIEAAFAVFNKDFSGFITKFKEAIDGLDNKFENKWFDVLFLMLNLVRQVENNNEKLFIIQQALAAEKEAINDWEYLYGALEIFEKIVAKISEEEVDLLKIALLGKDSHQTLPSAKEKPNTITDAGLKIAQEALAKKLPGITAYTEFNRYIKKDEKANNAILDKAILIEDMLCAKLSKTDAGRTVISDVTSLLVTKRLGKKDTLLNRKMKAAKKIIVPSRTASEVTSTNKCKVSTETNKRNPSQSAASAPSDMPKPAVVSKQLFTIVTVDKINSFQPLQQNEKSDKDYSDIKTLASVDNRKMADSKIDSVSRQVSTHKVDKVVSASSAAVTNAEQKEKSEKDVKSAHADKTIVKIPEKDVIEFHKAISEDKADIVQKLVNENKALANSKDANGNAAIMVAANSFHRDSWKIVLILLNAGADPLVIDSEGDNLLHKAIVQGQEEAVRVLSKYPDLLNAENEKCGQTPLYLSMYLEGFKDKIREILFSAGVDPCSIGQSGRNVLHRLLSECTTHLDSIRTLAKNEKLIDSKTSKKWDNATPLMIAAKEKENFESFKILLEAGANVSETDANGKNVLHYAAESGNVEVVRLLSTYPSLVSARSSKGETPFYLAVLGYCVKHAKNDDYEETIRILFKADSDISALNNDGWNILHFIAAFPSMHVASFIVQLLTADHKDLFTAKIKTGVGGRTPIMLVCRFGEETYKILLKCAYDLGVDRKLL